MHCAVFPLSHVDVLYVSRTSCVNADNVGEWQFESNHIWLVVIWCLVHKDWQLCAVEMVYG